MARKPKPVDVTDDAPVVINAQVEHQLCEALAGRERSAVVCDLTRRALTLRAKSVSIEDIAKAEQVEASTLDAWLASSRRTPTIEEAQRMLSDEITPLAIENHKHMLLAGDKRATMQTMAGVLKPRKASESKTTILVGVGTGAIGRDPLDVRVAVQVTK
jgi:hypothetical protein